MPRLIGGVRGQNHSCRRGVPVSCLRKVGLLCSSFVVGGCGNEILMMRISGLSFRRGPGRFKSVVSGVSTGLFNFFSWGWGDGGDGGVRVTVTKGVKDNGAALAGVLTGECN